MLGAAYDFRRVMPLIHTANSHRQRETVVGHSFMAFAKTGADDWNLRVKVILGQNLTEHLLLGGYAERSLIPASGYTTYTPTNHLFLWSEVCIKDRQFNYGFFAGYAKNLGTSHENRRKYYGRGHNIGHLMRVSPIISYQSGPVKLAGEIEYTRAYYGVPDKFGKVQNTRAVRNVRLTAAAIYIS